jgi:hypothetical protein
MINNHRTPSASLPICLLRIASHSRRLHSRRVRITSHSRRIRIAFVSRVYRIRVTLVSHSSCVCVVSRSHRDTKYTRHASPSRMPPLHHTVTYTTPTTPDLDKAIVCEKIAAADLCLLDGGTELLQLLDVVALLMRRIQKVGVAMGEFSVAPAH